MSRSRNILIVSLGASPSIVTETIWALAQRQPSFWPDKVIIVTTGQASGIDALVIGNGSGHWEAGFKLAELCEALKLPMVQVELVIAKQGDDQIMDISNEADAIAFGDTIARVVQQQTDAPETIVHLSIAGGRKTMSYHAGAAMTLFGRASDELSHVLVSPSTLEHCEDFWWPTASPSRVRHKFLKDDTGKSLRVSAHTDDVSITLVSTPFFRARDYLPSYVLENGLSYADTVQHANAVQEAHKLEIDLPEGAVRIGAIVLDLSPVELALYTFFADRRLKGEPKIPLSVLNSTANLERQTFDRIRAMVPHQNQGVRPQTNSDSASLGPSLTRLRRKLRNQLNDKLLVERFGVSKGSGKEKTCYGINANSDVIRLRMSDG